VLFVTSVELLALVW